MHLLWPQCSRSQLWLSCTQLGRTLTTVNSASRTFGHQIGQDLFDQQCSAFDDENGAFDYGRLADRIAAWWQRLEDGQRADERVVYTNGDLDAWYPLGQLTASADSSQVVINIPSMPIELRELWCMRFSHIVFADYGKSADLQSARPEDDVELATAKLHIKSIIVYWIGA